MIDFLTACSRSRSWTFRALDQADQPRGLRADHPLRLRVRAAADGRKAVPLHHQGEHHEAHGRPLSRLCSVRSRATTPDIEPRENLVDALCMGLVQRPEEFDVLVLPNLDGDIISDLTAWLVGGLGVAPGGEHRHGGRRLRGDARVGAQVHGPEQGQPDCDDPLREAHARPSRRARRGEAPRGCRRRGDRRGEERDVRLEADPRRPDSAVGTAEYADAIIARLG